MTKEYNASSVDVLEFPRNIQMRPTMYIGSVDNFGKMVIYREVLDNSVDELLNGFGKEILTIVDSVKRTISVKDQGRGIPFDHHEKFKCSVMEVLCSKMHAGGKFDKNSYKTSGGLNGIGIKATNALSTFFHIESKRPGAGYRMEFENGIKVKESKIRGSKQSGTMITFQPNPEIFSEAETEFPSKTDFVEMLELRSYLNPKVPFVLEYDGERTVFLADSIADFIDSQLTEKELLIPEHIVVSGEGDGKNVGEIDLAFNYSKSSLKENFYGFCNTIFQRDGGSHITGFKMAFGRIFQKFIKDNDLLKGRDKDLEVKPADFFEGMYCIISIKHAEPLYSGQDKQKLNSSDATGAVSSVTYAALVDWVETNKSEAKKISLMAVASAKNRIKNLKSKEASRAQLTGDAFSMNDSSKLADCISRDPSECEIFIVEGDSAGGTCKDGRDRNTQAIFPLRGKCVNSLDLDLAAVIKNNEYSDLFNVLRCGKGVDFDYEKLRYSKIVLLSDSDVDGSHISTLLATFFWQHMRPLIENGNVFVAKPPLYRVQLNKNDYIYLQDRSELIEFVSDKYSEVAKRLNYRLAEDKGKGYKFVRSPKALLAKLEEFSGEIAETGAAIGIPLDILSRVLEFAKTADLEETLNDFLDSDYTDSLTLNDDGHCSFIFQDEASSKHNSFCTLIAGGEENENDESRIAKLEELLASYTEKKLNKVKVYKDDSNKLSNMLYAFHDIKDLTDKSITVSRFKGLGEMSADQLWETTMDPETRTLISLEAEDFSDEGFAHEVINLLMTKKTNGPSMRREVMKDNFPEFDKELLDI